MAMCQTKKAEPLGLSLLFFDQASAPDPAVDLVVQLLAQHHTGFRVDF